MTQYDLWWIHDEGIGADNDRMVFGGSFKSTADALADAGNFRRALWREANNDTDRARVLAGEIIVDCRLIPESGDF